MYIHIGIYLYLDYMKRKILPTLLVSKMSESRVNKSGLLYFIDLFTFLQLIYKFQTLQYNVIKTDISPVVNPPMAIYHLILSKTCSLTSV